MNKLRIILCAWIGCLLAGCGGGSREVPVTRVQQGTISSQINTNGKVEPIEFAIVKAPVGGTVSQAPHSTGDRIRSGATVAELSRGDAAAALQAAEARLAAARAELRAAQQGGAPRQRAELESRIAQLRIRISQSQRERESLARLEQKGAATREEVRQAAQNVERLQEELRGLETQIASLRSDAEQEAAQARVQEAEAGLAGARRQVSTHVIRSPIGGTIYELSVKPGDFLQPGSDVARVGDLTRVRIRVYVDEPELGRVAPGQMVEVTWDAIPGRAWKGEVERGATQIVSLGSRQVGEILVTVDNAEGELIPGTNVNAAIRTAAAENVLVIPKEALRSRVEGTGVYVIRDGVAAWRAIGIGISNVTHVEVREGLAEGDTVALAVDPELEEGEQITPVQSR